MWPATFSRGSHQGLASIGSQCERNLDDSDISGLSPRKSVGSIEIGKNTGEAGLGESRYFAIGRPGLEMPTDT